MTDYALRLLIYLGEHPQRLCTIAEVAQAYQISEPHLMKITHQLGLQGWITTVRGKGGGMRLAKAPDAINLGALVQQIEPDFALVECMGRGADCKLTGACALTGILDRALQAFLAELAVHTLADLLHTRSQPLSAPPGLTAISVVSRLGKTGS